MRWHSYFGSLLFLGALCLVATGAPSHGQNLNQKFGASWDCSYITAGSPIYDACRKCEVQNLDFFKDSATDGHCVPRSSASARPPDAVPAYTDTTPPPRQNTEPVRQRQWGAIACAVWRDGNGQAHVAVGSAIGYSTEQEAISLAQSQCKGRGGRKCDAESFNNGCGYIAVGNARGRVGCQSGTTIDRATSKCRAQGYTCKTPIGGCVNQ